MRGSEESGRSGGECGGSGGAGESVEGAGERARSREGFTQGASLVLSLTMAVCGIRIVPMRRQGRDWRSGPIKYYAFGNGVNKETHRFFVNQHDHD